jgi:thiamine-phosphate pyrophosphorylase
MDGKLVAWARAVKSRRRQAHRKPLPVLWLFTDAARLPDPLAAASVLPKGLCGVVLRHDDDPERRALGLALARVCRQRRLALVVAGDPRLAARLGAGVHLRGGWKHAPPPPPGTGRMITASAHDLRELRRAERAGAGLVFLSPAFPTASHPGGRTLGAPRWAALARTVRLSVAALGGVDGGRAASLPRFCAGAGAIGALAPARDTCGTAGTVFRKCHGAPVKRIAGA